MKPEAERAIRTIDELITWLAAKKIIKNQPALERLTSALKVIVENCDHDNAENEAEINQMAETIYKQTLILRGCGFTQFGIKEMLKHETEDLDDFVRKYDRNEAAQPLNFPTVIDLLKLEVRVKNELKGTHLKIDQWN